MKEEEGEAPSACLGGVIVQVTKVQKGQARVIHRLYIKDGHCTKCEEFSFSGSALHLHSFL